MSTISNYEEFLNSKRQLEGYYGFDPIWIPDFLFDFQAKLVEWALRKGRCAIFADCGLGKTPMQLVWADNVVRKTNGRVLILTPLAVGIQTAHEAEKFGIEATRSGDGLPKSNIVVTNYERLHHFNASDFVGVVCDESSILKDFEGKTKAAVTEFMRLCKYRLLCTATAAPNDYIELGTSSEALGEMGYLDMLKRFFKATDGTYTHGGGNGMRRFSKNPFGGKFRFRGHSEEHFWRWVCSWARAIRKPSDIGCEDGRYQLPPLTTSEHIVSARTANPEYLFDLPAVGLAEQRDERRRTLHERCEMAAQLTCSHEKPVISWCHLNDEGDLMEQLIPNSVQVSGADSDDEKEEKLSAFINGEFRALVSKPKIAGLGLNLQHCAHQTFFPSHSFEQWYQSIRRSWRFGQKSPVHVDVISSEGESGVLKNLKRKAEAAEQMFSLLVELMNNELKIEKKNLFTKQAQHPSWI